MKLAGKEITLKMIGEWIVCAIIGLIGGFLILMIVYSLSNQFAKAISSATYSTFLN